MSSLRSSSETTGRITRPVLIVIGVTSAYVVLAVLILIDSEIETIPSATAGVAVLAGVTVGVATIGAFADDGIRERWTRSRGLRFLVLFVYVSATTTLLQTAPAPTAVGLVAQIVAMLAAQARLTLRT